MLGEGNGGGALAFLPADRVVAAQHAWLSPLPPEGASAIVHRDTAHAPEIAPRQRVRAPDLRARGIVDRIVPEAAPASPARLGQLLRDELASLGGPRRGAGWPVAAAGTGSWERLTRLT